MCELCFRQSEHAQALLARAKGSTFDTAERVTVQPATGFLHPNVVLEFTNARQTKKIVLLATRRAYNPNLQVTITQARHVCSQHSLLLALSMNRIHRAYSGQARLELLSLVTRGQVRTFKLNSFTHDVLHLSLIYLPT